MPNLRAAEKRVRQTHKRTARNRTVRSRVRTYVKRVRRALAEGNATEARKWLDVTQRQVDRAVSKGVLHRRTGSRTISRLGRQVGQLES